MVLTYKGFEVEIPFEAIQIEKLDLLQTLNDHTTLKLSLLIPEGKMQEYIQMSVSKEKVIIKTYHERLKKKYILLAAKITRITMAYEGDLQVLKLEGISYTKDFDIQKRNRTFYDLSLTYQDVIRKVLAPYDQKDFIDHISHKAVIPHLLVQYEETDWQFIKRLATHFQSILLADTGATFGRFFFGLPRLDYQMSIQQDDYDIVRDIATYNQHMSESVALGLLQHYTSWEIVSYKPLYIGEEVMFNNVKCQVTKIHTFTENQDIKTVYTLCIFSGVKSIYSTNPKVYGMSLPAVVKERKGNTLRVHFDIDEKYEAKPKNQFFTYAIESSSWYCMPEVGSKVHIYFPTNDEKDVIAVHAIRIADSAQPYFGRTANPDDKSFSNVTGSEMKLTPSDMSFAADNAKTICLKLSQDGNVSLVGKNIDFKAKEDMEVGIREPADPKVEPLRPKNISFSAVNKLELSKGGELGAQMIEQTFLQAPMIKYMATVKEAAMAIPPEMDLSANDAQMMNDINSAAKQKMEDKIAASKQKFGFGAIAMAIGVGALVVAATVFTGGAALVAVAAGATAMAVGASEMHEATQDYSKSQSGDYSKSFNFMRDVVCGGNETLYSIVKYGSVIISGAMVAWAIGGPAVLKKAIGDGTLDVGMEMIGDFLDDGKINKGLDYYAKTFTTSFVMGGAGGGAVDKLMNTKYLKALSCNQKWGVKTLLDTFLDSGANIATTGEADFLRSLISNGITNKLFLGDPVDAVTGSLYIPAIDLTLPDIHEEFKIERKYESVNKIVGVFGKGWTASFATKLYITPQRIDLMCMDGHMETFDFQEDKWINTKGGALTYQLKMQGEQWLVQNVLESKTYLYNQLGQLLSITDIHGNQLTLTYQGPYIDTLTTFSNYHLYFTYIDNKVTEIRDDIGRTVQYKYHEDYLTEVVHVDYGITHYTYNENGLIDSITDQNGQTYTKNFFDHKGRVIAQDYPNGDRCEITYDEDNRENLFYYTMSQRTERCKYNSEKLVTHQFYEDGSYEEYAYDSYQNKIYEKDRNGNETFRKFDIYGKLIEEVLPNQLKTTYEYNHNRQLLRQINSSGSEILYTYDKFNNLIEQCTKVNIGVWQKLTFEYDKYGRRVTQTNSLGHKTTYEYPLSDIILAEPSKVITPEGESYLYEYDQIGRNIAIQTTYGTVEFGYNPLNYITSIKDGNGNITRKYYDKMGNLIGFVPPNAYDINADNGEGYTYEYDHMDRLLAIRNPLGHINKLIRDSEGNIVKEIHPSYYNAYTQDGIGVSYVYDKDNRKIKTIYPDGGIERFFYDSNGNVIKHITPAYYKEETDDGLGYCYTYNAMNQLVQIIDEQGRVMQHFTYNALGQIIEITDSKGYTTYQTYDLLGNLLEKRVPVEIVDHEVRYQLTRYTYDSEGNKLTEQQGCDLVGEKEYANYYHTLTFTYDRMGRVISVKDGHGAKVMYRYNCLNQKVYESFKVNENVTQTIYYRYDQAGQLIEKKEELDQRFLAPEMPSKSVWAITQYEYDKNGNLTKEISPKGYVTEKVYDALDQVIGQYEIDKQNGIYRKWQYHYDPAGRLTESIDITGETPKTTRYTYDAKDRLTHYTDVLGHTTRLFYDANDRMIKEVLPAQYDAQLDDGPGTTYSYNFQDKVTATHNAMGELIQEMAYNAHGELIDVQNGAHEKVSYTYNLLGQMKEIITPNSRVQNKAAQTYYYDARGNITGIVDGNGNTTRYDLDDWGRIVQIITPEGGSERYTYDYAGHITSTTDANGGTITYKYNSQGKVCEIIDQEGLSEYFYYNEEGQLSCHIDREGNRVTTTYNRDGNIVFRQGYDAKQDGVITESFKYYLDGLLSDARTKGMAYHYTYTPDGNLQSKSASGRNLLAYTYTPNGKIASIQDVTGKITHYSYDNANRTQHLTDETGKSLAAYSYGVSGQVEKIVYGNGITSTYSYDGDENVKSLVTVTSTGEVLVDYKYAYDLNGNRLNKVGSQHQVYYSYDKMNRLVEASYDGKQESFTYDQVGNRLTKTTNGITEKYCYNIKNQLTQLHQKNGITYFTYSLQGDTIKEATPTGTNDYSYNVFHQQVKASMQNGDTLISRYDAEGLRYELEENERLVKFIFHKENVLVETDANNELISRFARGYEVVGAEIRNEDCNTYSTYYYHPDEQGSTLYITDEAAVIKNHYFYDAFGNVLNSEELVHNRITYVGQQFDSITQQYYLRARYYNPIIGRFTQEDIYRGDGLNLYAYCKNNPIVYYDPSGYNRVVPFDLGELHYDDLNKINFNSYLKDLIGDPPADMVDPHAHHIVFKLGRGTRQKKLVRELQEILYKDYGINPIKGKEVLGWAPNRGTKGQHSYKTLKALADDIKVVKAAGGTYDDIVEVLNYHKEIAATRKSNYKPREKTTRVCKK